MYCSRLPGLTDNEKVLFAQGNRLFTERWGAAPGLAQTRDGLGPILNAESCSSCHFRNGRAQPPANRSDPERGFFLRLGSVDGIAPDPVLGDQLQDQAIVGLPVEGAVRIIVEEVAGVFGDGSAFSLAKPTYVVLDTHGRPREQQPRLSPRITPAIAGVGLLEAVPSEDIINAQDPDDANGDGISGRAHMIKGQKDGTDSLGRFGWKAGIPSVREQTVDALADDIGITSSGRREQPCTAAQPECLASPTGGDPEASDHQIDVIAFFARALAVPERRDPDPSSNKQAEALFGDLGCSSCHLTELRTGASDIESIANKTIHPYTDLLLHDMGPGLASDLAEGDASGAEWRTPPLWGIGMVEVVNGHTRFLHDGRARSLEEAVLWHGGEAQKARERFTSLSAEERSALIAFLESL